MRENLLHLDKNELWAELFPSEYFHAPLVPWQALAAQAARQHYNLQLKKKVWFGWHSLVQKHWKVRVEQACRARAEEVCTRLSAEYEAKLAEVNTRVKDESLCV